MSLLLLVCPELRSAKFLRVADGEVIPMVRKSPIISFFAHRARWAFFESISCMRSEFASHDLVCVEYALVEQWWMGLKYCKSVVEV